MKENIYIKKIRNETQQDKPYDEYKHLFFEYIDYLKGVLADDPRDVFAICQLAITYLEAGEPEEKSIELMKTALEDYKEELTADEKHMLLTNIAFFYDDL